MKIILFAGLLASISAQAFDGRIQEGDELEIRIKQQIRIPMGRELISFGPAVDDRTMNSCGVKMKENSKLDRHIEFGKTFKTRVNHGEKGIFPSLILSPRNPSSKISYFEISMFFGQIDTYERLKRSLDYQCVSFELIGHRPGPLENSVSVE